MVIVDMWFYVKRLYYVIVSINCVIVMVGVIFCSWFKWNKKSPMLSAPGILSLSKNTLFSVT